MTLVITVLIPIGKLSLLASVGLAAILASNFDNPRSSAPYLIGSLCLAIGILVLIWRAT